MKEIRTEGVRKKSKSSRTSWFYLINIMEGIILNPIKEKKKSSARPIKGH